MNIVFISTVGALLAETPPVKGSPSLETGTVVLALLVLAFAWLAKSLVNLRTELDELRNSRETSARTSAPVSEVVAVAGRPTPGEIAAIAAAVHVMLGSRARLVAVGLADASAQQAWSREGRRQVFQSHQLR